VHVVASGDTLIGLARHYYRDPARWPQIVHANPHVKNPNLIRLGERLRLPD
jgi:nucleoid-associated protein YgaU